MGHRTGYECMKVGSWEWRNAGTTSFRCFSQHGRRWARILLAVMFALWEYRDLMDGKAETEAVVKVLCRILQVISLTSRALGLLG